MERRPWECWLNFLITPLCRQKLTPQSTELQWAAGITKSLLPLNWWQHFVPTVSYVDSSSAEPLEGDRNLTVQLSLTCHQSMRRMRRKRPEWRQLREMRFHKQIRHPSDGRDLPGCQAWRLTPWDTLSKPRLPDLHVLLFMNYRALQK